MRPLLSAFSLFTLMTLAIVCELAFIAMMMDDSNPIIVKVAFPILILVASVVHFGSR